MTDELVRLNLGCGADYQLGWINVDKYFAGRIDVNNDIATLKSFEDNMADLILSSHSLEHLSKYDGERAIKRWYQVLKPGGTLYIIVPNFPFMVRLWLDCYDNDVPDPWGYRIKTIFGDQGHSGEYHKHGYDADSLSKLLEDAGFIDVQVETKPKFDFDFGDLDNAQILATAKKPE